MRTRLMALACAAFLIGATRRPAAQEFLMAFPPGAAAQDVIFGGVGRVPGPEMGLIAIEPFGALSPVKDAPYSADAITETTQLLADGNRIEQRAAAAIARDSTGRVRREQDAVAFGGLVAKSRGPLVTISDPAGVHITLDTERRIAYRINTPPVANGAAGRMRVETFRREFEMPVPPPPGGAAAGARTQIQFSVREDRAVTVTGAGPDLPPMTAAFESTDARTEQLGERDIEGVRAEGTRTTMTIQANAIGNQAPIVIVSERWYSPELQVVVMTRRSDPRFGETVYRLVNIVRAEPSTDLFEIPSDYRIQDQPLPPR
jgi:hypothetical protein